MERAEAGEDTHLANGVFEACDGSEHFREGDQAIGYSLGPSVDGRGAVDILVDTLVDEVPWAVRELVDVVSDSKQDSQHVVEVSGDGRVTTYCMTVDEIMAQDATANPTAILLMGVNRILAFRNAG